MIRIAAAALCLVFMGASALAQSAGDPDPLTLPTKGAGDDIVVTGTLERPLPMPDGDNRSARQRSRDRSKFDRCVMKIQDRDTDSPNANPVGIAPEEACAARLGMRDRNALPDRKSRNQ